MIQARIADRFVLLSPLGSGGEARVFRSRDERDGGEVAVRLALGPVSSVISAAPARNHGRWVRFIDSGMDPQHGAYQVFELLEGQTLGEIARQSALDTESWRALVDQSLDAVEEIHLAGWVHGDINADNFMLVPSGWKLLELPFYRFESPAKRSAMFGSIYTLAPEQIDGAKPNARSDLYSLGCLYYYAASRAWPHAGTTVQEIAIQRLMQPVPDLKVVGTDLPPAWCDWVMKLLARWPMERPPSLGTARQLLADAVA
jgi:serine/threonine protein kinase